MCAGAIVAARVRTLVIGAWDPKAGACGSVWDLVRDTRANPVSYTHLTLPTNREV